MFDSLVLVLMLASFAFLAPLRFDGDQLFALVAMTAIGASGFITQPRRQVDMRLPAACFLLAVSTMLWDFAWFKLYAVVIAFLLLNCIKTIAERTRIPVRALGWILAAVAVLSIAIVWIDTKTLTTIWARCYVDVGSFFGKPWALGAFAAMSIPLIAVAHPALTITAAPLLWASRSTLCIFAGAVAYFLVLTEKRRAWRIWAVIPGILAVLAHIIREGGLENHRLKVWRGVWKSAWESPIFGHGFGSWEHSAWVEIINGNIVVQQFLHNEWYQHFWDQGLAGLLPAAAWFWSVQVGVRQELRDALLVTALLALFHPILHWGRLSFLPLVIFGYAVADRARLKKIEREALAFRKEIYGF